MSNYVIARDGTVRHRYNGDTLGHIKPTTLGIGYDATYRGRDVGGYRLRWQAAQAVWDAHATALTPTGPLPWPVGASIGDHMRDYHSGERPGRLLSEVHAEQHQEEDYAVIIPHTHQDAP